MAEQPHLWRIWLKISSMLIGSFVAIAALSLQVRADAEIVSVMYPPWWSVQEVMLAAASADSGIVRLTSVPGMVVVQSDLRQGLTKLRKSGAWFLLDPQAIAACFRS